jgi:putative chitinase
VATKYPLLSAAWFWNSRALNSLADKGATDVDVSAITKKVNGGVNGLADRLAKFKKFYSILN